MSHPRLNVGWIGIRREQEDFAELLCAAGHTITPINLAAPENIGQCSAIALNVPATSVKAIVQEISRHLRPGQILFSLDVNKGVGEFAALGALGVLPVSYGFLGAETWLVTAADERALALGIFLIEEAGHIAIACAEEKRARCAAHYVYAQMTQAIATKAADSLRNFAGVDVDVTDQPLATETIYAAFPSISDPIERTAFVEAARRVGELSSNVELEMWAMQEDLQ
ncbi:MAG: hypothetical protein SOW59_05660 [Corynebacterium sp.]|nr:hypothetical protein [Corynebacterium sp.]